MIKLASPPRRKLLLVNPPHFISREHDFEIGIPVHLALIGESACKQDWTIEYLDMPLEEKEGIDSFKELDRRMKDYSIQLVGISNHTLRTAETTARVADHIKCKRSDIQIMVGGVNATFMWHQLLQDHTTIDFIVRGYAQPCIEAFLQNYPHLEYSAVPGLAYRVNEQFKTNPTAAIIPDHLSPPSLECLNPERYLNWNTTYPIMTHTGCTFSCNFCTSVMPDRCQRHEVYRPIEDVVREMQNAFALGFDRFFLTDNIFTSCESYCLDLCRSIATTPLCKKISWVCMTRAETVTRPVLTAMRTAGCHNIAMGVEIASISQWGKLQKGSFSANRLVSAFKLARDVGLSTTAYIIVGTPDQSQEDVDATITLLRTIDPDYRVISFFQPFPGTPYWDNPSAYGLSGFEPFDRWAFHENPVCETKHLDKSSQLDSMIQLHLDRGSGIGIKPRRHSLTLHEATSWPHIPSSPSIAQDVLTALEQSQNIYDALDLLARRCGSSYRLVALYWLSAALCENVLSLTHSIRHSMGHCPNIMYQNSRFSYSSEIHDEHSTL